MLFGGLVSVGVSVTVGLDVGLLGDITIVSSASGVDVRLALLPVLDEMRDVGRLVGIWNNERMAIKKKLKETLPFHFRHWQL